MIKVYSSPYIADCDQLRMSLSSAGISSDMRNEFGHPIGLAALGGAAGFAAPEVWVDDADRAEAMRIVQSFIQAISNRSQPAEHPDPEWICPRCNETVDATLDACWNCDTPRPPP